MIVWSVRNVLLIMFTVLSVYYALLVISTVCSVCYVLLVVFVLGYVISQPSVTAQFVLVVFAVWCVWNVLLALFPVAAGIVVSGRVIASADSR